MSKILGRMALIGVLVLGISLSCSSDGRRCVEPEPEPEPVLQMAYFFREVVSDCEGCPTCYNVYWCFLCTKDTVEYRGHWDPSDPMNPPDWPAPVWQAESCFDSWEPGCRRDLGAGSSDPTLTPRADRESEEIALWLCGGLIARQDLYERISHDLSSIRSNYTAEIPQLGQIHFSPHLRTDAIWVSLTSEGAYEFRQGEFHDLDSLNALYRVSDIQASMSAMLLCLTFEGRYNTVDLAQIYSGVPSVISAEPIESAGTSPCEGTTVLAWPRWSTHEVGMGIR